MSQPSENLAEPIAIVSIGAIFPGRGTTTGFWRDIRDGVASFADVPETHWRLDDYYDSDPNAPDRTYGRRGAFLSPLAFDPVAFGVPPNALDSTDTAQLLALVAAKQVLEEAEHECAGRIDRQKTSIILGVASATELTAHMAGRLSRPAWIRGLRDAGLEEARVQDIADRISANFVTWKESTFPGLLGNVVAGRVANRLDLGGSNYVTDAACASSLSAMQIALHELHIGDSDTVITGGVDTLNDILMYMCFSKTPALSRSGEIRPFDAAADGTMLGEGVGMMALRRLSDAERDGNRVHAVIRGLAGASDGRATAIYAPLATGQAKALRRSYEKAGYGPDSVSLVEAHGTGTMAGDRTELEGLHAVFDPDGEVETPWCAIGSVKSQIGHTKAAAGAASLLKVVGALSRKVLPPTLNVEEPAGPLREKSPFYLNTTARPWITPQGEPRRASVSSFGFGGSNFHVTLEEYAGPNAVQPPRTVPDELLLFSASDNDALVFAIEAALDRIDSEGALARAASESHAEFDPQAAVRGAIVAATPDEAATRAERLVEAIRSGRAGQAPLGAGLCYARGETPAGGLAFLFSGQGSQYVGMGSELAMAFPPARAVWDSAARHSALEGLRLDELAFPPESFDQEEAMAKEVRLTLMQHAQPAIAAVALAQLALLERLGLRPDMAAGHSFGEVMALHAAGVFDAETALAVAAERGAIMADAAEGSDGAMLALQADAERAEALLAGCSGNALIANDNAPGQTVISGSIDEVQAVRAAADAAGIKARRLPVATAFHSPIVAPACQPFAEALSRHVISAPALPVFANTTAAPYRRDRDAVAAGLSGQIAQPVRFRESLEAMYAAGARTFVEVGPGAVLAGLARNALDGGDVQVVSLDTARDRDTRAFLSALAQLAVSGYSLDVAALYEGLPPEPAPAPAPKFAVEISGANYGKPYPCPPSPAVPACQTPPNPPTPDQGDPSQMKPNGTPPIAAQAEPGNSAHAPAQAGDLSAASREISARHGAFLQVMSQAHTAFLQAMGGVSSAPASAPAQMPASAPPVAPPAAPPQPSRFAEMPAPPAMPAAPAPEVPADAANGPAGQAMAVAEPDPLAMVTALVSEKTGYPGDMLDADMDLEGELGVDSIKQVEILSTLRERLPAMPEVAPERLAELRTIRLVADFISDQAPISSDAPVTSSTSGPGGQSAPAPGGAAASSPQSNGALTPDSVRGLISDKTGYPPDLLDDDMDLEGELGIDSIKQVEILSALRETHPGLPEVEPEQLAELRTIRKIADFFG